MGTIALDQLLPEHTASVMVTENGRRLPLTFRLEAGDLSPDATSLTHWFLRSWCADRDRAECDELIEILRSPRPRRGAAVAAGGVDLEVNPFLCRLRYTTDDRSGSWVEVPTLDLLNAVRQLRALLSLRSRAA